MLRNIASSVSGCLSSVMKIPQEFTVSVRYRYFKDKPTLMRRWGYEDKLAWRGPLPRIVSGNRVPKPEYNPKNVWTEKRSLFGQNDYIDILGNPKLHPVLISYNVPPWLRGFKGNEYQMLLRKRGFFGRKMQKSSPHAFHRLRRNIIYLYRFLNFNKPQNIYPKEYHRMLKDK